MIAKCKMKRVTWATCVEPVNHFKTEMVSEQVLYSKHTICECALSQMAYAIFHTGCMDSMISDTHSLMQLLLSSIPKGIDVCCNRYGLPSCYVLGPLLHSWSISGLSKMYNNHVIHYHCNKDEKDLTLPLADDQCQALRITERWGYS